MRIISGKLRGKIIRAPKNLPVRPTTDMAKESLFNILNNRVYYEDMEVLDLFCGIGSISLELFSRGVASVTAVDHHGATIQFLKKTIEDLSITNITLQRADVLGFLRTAYRKYDFIFADPPYDFPEYDEVIRMVFDREMLKEAGFLVVEHDRRQNFKDHPYFFEHRKYGGVEFSFFSKDVDKE
ncbi:MAG: 16S rRNA (guanine(966)-N(2))-methyltransferase RsmD [Cryomorphaceae bacterium]|nr:16S rRNA (guanine(966)-N(2))-methyltransferase RsmD [Cryomorphaceae bacterium]